MLTINGENVDDSLIQKEFNRLKPSYDRQFPNQSEEERTKQLMEWSKENIIEQVLLRQAAAQSSIDIPGKEILERYTRLVRQVGGEQNLLQRSGATTDLAVKRDIELQLKTEAFLKQITDAPSAPTREEIEAYYEKNKESDFTAPERVRAAHIVKHCKSNDEKKKAYKEMRKIKGELQKGRPFEEIAGEHSDCADNGGDLGYFPRGHMVQGFENVVFDDMEINDVSDIFWTEFGYHIAKKYDHVPPGPIPLEKVSDHIARELHKESKQKALYAFLDELRAKAEIVEK
ncbi:MAG: hypothetical protein GF401_10625 [Chitinivibrionales bacterium]|nr:hypothetical protein [Chitinivibrionales bacterium]